MDKLKITKISFVILTLLLFPSCANFETQNHDVTSTNTISSETDSISGENFDSYLEISGSGEAPVDGDNTYIWSDGSNYSGAWADGKANGRGVYTTGDYYLDGVFADNKLESGTLTVTSEKYEITLSVYNGVISDRAKIKFPSGDIYSGGWDNGIAGSGSMEYNNGDSFTGNFLNGKRHGEGTYVWKNGESYTGHWENDKMNGDGIYYYNKEKTHSLSGFFKDNIPQGSLVYKNKGYTYTTTWANGKCTKIVQEG